MQDKHDLRLRRGERNSGRHCVPPGCAWSGSERSSTGGFAGRAGRPADPQGQAQYLIQFGYAGLTAAYEHGFIVDRQVHHGNPADVPQLVPIVERVTARAGRVPDMVVASREFGTAARRPVTIRDPRQGSAAI